MKPWAVLLCAFGLTPGAWAQESRIRVFAYGAYDLTGLSFSDISTFPSFLEEGTSNRIYDGGRGAVFEAGGLLGIVKSFGVMGSIEIYQSAFDGSFQESLPHPLLFDRPRTVAGNVTGLEYREKAIHLDAVYTRHFSSLTVDAFGGPTLFFTEAELLNSVTTTSTYPFHEVTVTGTTNGTFDDNPIGYNAGGALTFRWTDLLGVSFQARYSKGTIRFTRDDGGEIELDAGGFRLGGGIRLSF